MIKYILKIKQNILKCHKIRSFEIKHLSISKIVVILYHFT